MSNIQDLLSIIEDLANGEIGSSEAEERIKAFSTSNFIGVISNLRHYLDDEDIRSRDRAYKEMQEKELHKLIQYLKSGDYEKADTISFLCESSVL